MSEQLAEQVRSIVAAYDPARPAGAAESLRALWLQFKPKSMAVIKAGQREQQETIGIPIPVLKEIAQEVVRMARQRVHDFVPLMQWLWDRCGREARVIALLALGAMELADPATVVPLLKQLCRSCLTWEDADRLALDALEPVVRKKPQEWLEAMSSWLADENKWVRRAGVTVVGRLPMKSPAYTARCLEMAEPLLMDEDVDVKKAVSFAIRLAVRGQVAPVRDFLQRHVPPADPTATWVLCDVIRSMGRAFLPEFAPLLPLYERWAIDPGLAGRDRRSVESAVAVLRAGAGQSASR